MKSMEIDKGLIAENQNKMWGKNEYQSLFMIFVAIYLFIAVIVPNYIFLPVNVIGPSMLPTLENQDKVILYKRGNINYGDIIVIYAPNLYNWQENTLGEDIIKRVMGLPGDTVWFEKHSDGNNYFHRQREENGTAVETVYLKEHYISTETSIKNEDMLYPKEKIKINEGEFYVLGDNRAVSQDSRYESVGKVKAEHIKGKVLLIIRKGVPIFFKKVSF